MEKLLEDYGLLVDGELYNPRTQRYIQASNANIRRIYDILINELPPLPPLPQEAPPLPLSEPPERDFFSMVAGNRRYVIKVNLSNGLIETFMLNSNTVEQVSNLLNRGYREIEQNGYSSDAIFRANILGVLDYTVEEVKGSISNRDGSYFKYLNETKLDLTRYQILREEDSVEILKEQCLLYSLKQQGISETLINNIKLSITNNNIPKKDLVKISNIIKKKIIIYSYKDDKKITSQSYGDFTEEVNVALYLNHYFTYEKTDYNKFFIKNYNELKDIDGAKSFYRQHRQNYLSSDELKIKCNSLYLIRKLYKNNLFKENSYKLSRVVDGADEELDVIPLDNIEEEQTEHSNNKKVNKYKIFYADTETVVIGEVHKIFKFGIIGENDSSTTIFNYDEDWVNKLFNYVKKRTGKEEKPIIYFHNLKYDFVASIKKYITCSNPLIKDNNMYRVEIRNYGYTIELRDSCKLISAPLKAFTDIFGLPKKLKKKEAINYTFYNFEMSKTEHSVNDYIKNFNEEEKKIFFDAMNNKRFNFKNDTFNALEYYDYYLEYDCLVLKEGLKELKKIMEKATSTNDKKPLDIFNYLTISSFANSYMEQNGAYDGVYGLSGNIREFVARAVYGGRVNVYEPCKKQVIETMISDFDGVSLYPSAMYRMCSESGVPKGKAKRITSDFLTKDYYVVKIKITKINKQQKNPFIALRTKDGIDYINKIDEAMITYVDKITLEDYIKFHEIEYEFIDGIYWNEGFNPSLGFLVKELFDCRLSYKQQMKKCTNEDERSGLDALQNMIKLIMNSCYGKTITRKSTREIIYLNKKSWNKETKKWSENNDNLNNYIYNNFNTIISYKDINENQVEITKTKMDITSNLGHVGCYILSYSKRIMNEVMGIASDNDINIYYQDTDSMHMDYDKIEKLASIYKEVYNKELIGEYLGQFHSDFKLKGAVGEVLSTKSIFLGKKSYIDMLQGKDKEGNVIVDIHHRMKGATENSIIYEVENNCNGDYFKLYEKLSKGEKVNFILNPYDDKVMFEFTEEGVRTRKTGEFTREMSF